MIVKVKGIAYDTSEGPIILLTDADENKVLPIGVGMFEAHAVASAMGIIPQVCRPLTQDLTLDVCKTLGANITSVKISDVQDRTYFAELYLSSGADNYLVDVRPSDAIALAIKAGVPINISNALQEQMLDIQEIFADGAQHALEELSGDLLEEYKKSLN